MNNNTIKICSDCKNKLIVKVKKVGVTGNSAICYICKKKRYSYDYRLDLEEKNNELI